MSESYEEKVERAEKLADDGVFGEAAGLLEEILREGHISRTLLAMHSDYLRLAQECFHAELLEQAGDSKDVLALHYAKQLSGTRQLRFLNERLAGGEFDESIETELKLLRFRNALRAGDPVALSDFRAIWALGEAKAPLKRLRQPLLYAVANAHSPKSVALIRDLANSRELPSTVIEFLISKAHSLQCLHGERPRFVASYNEAGFRDVDRSRRDRDGDDESPSSTIMH